MSPKTVRRSTTARTLTAVAVASAALALLAAVLLVLAPTTLLRVAMATLLVGQGLTLAGSLVQLRQLRRSAESGDQALRSS